MKDIILLAESLESIVRLSDEDAGSLLKALATGDDGNLSEIASIIFPLIKGQVDRMTDLREKRSSAGRIGGSKPKQTVSKTEANEKQNEAPVPVPVPVPDPVPVPEPNLNHKGKREINLPIRASLPPMLDEVEVVKALEDFRAMRKAKKKPMTLRAEELLVKELTKLSGGDPGKAVEILNQSISNAWTGIYPVHENEQTSERSIKERLAALS